MNKYVREQLKKRRHSSFQPTFQYPRALPSSQSPQKNSTSQTVDELRDPPLVLHPRKSIRERTDSIKARLETLKRQNSRFSPSLEMENKRKSEDTVKNEKRKSFLNEMVKETIESEISERMGHVYKSIYELYGKHSGEIQEMIEKVDKAVGAVQSDVMQSNALLNSRCKQMEV